MVRVCFALALLICLNSAFSYKFLINVHPRSLSSSICTSRFATSHRSRHLETKTFISESRFQPKNYLRGPSPLTAVLALDKISELGDSENESPDLVNAGRFFPFVIPSFRCSFHVLFFSLACFIENIEF